MIDSSFARCADLIGKQDYAGNEASIQVHSAGVTSLLRRAQAAGVEHRLLALFSGYLDRAIDSGHGHAELPAVFAQFVATGGA